MPNPILIRKLIVFSEGTGFNYTFANSQAETYWNALTTANGGVPVDGALYGITTNELAQAIDSFFVTGAFRGWLTDMVGMYPLIGGTAATHAINAINPGTYNITWTGSPTHDKNGVTFNGTSQYGRTGIIPSTHLLLNNVHLSTLSNTTTSATKAHINARNGTTEVLQLAYIAGGVNKTAWRSYDISGGQIYSSTSNKADGDWIGTRTASNSSKIILEGVADGAINTSGGAQPAFELYLGAGNNSGVAENYSDGTYKSFTIGKGLSDLKALTLRDARRSLNQSLNRL